jgi:hypothetical protein
MPNLLGQFKKHQKSFIFANFEPAANVVKYTQKTTNNFVLEKLSCCCYPNAKETAL